MGNIIHMYKYDQLRQHLISDQINPIVFATEENNQMFDNINDKIIFSYLRTKIH